MSTIIEVGDAVVVVEKLAKGPAAGWQVTYHGQSRTTEIGGVRWKQGETIELMDMEIVMRAKKTAHFQVMPPRVKVEYGRVFKIFRVDHTKAALDAYFYMDPTDIPQPSHEFVIVSPAGAMHSFKEGEIRLPGESDLKKLAVAEQKEVMRGEIPYRGRLKLKGRGKWGRGNEL